jgi:3-methylcrotonyl-CoA carboxylase alpha subunit
MIAKLIVWDEDRPRALARMREALARCEVVGPKSNIAFLETLVRHPTIVGGTIDTGYLDRHLDEFLAGDAAPSPAALFAAATAVLLHEEQTALDAARAGGDPHSPWAMADGWRIGHSGKRIAVLAQRGERHEIEAHGHGGEYMLAHGDRRCAVRHARIEGDWLSAHFDDEARRVRVAVDEQRVRVHTGEGARESFVRAPAFAFESGSHEGGDRVIAPMPGRVVLVRAKAGDEVEKDQELLVMEAMKMELTLRAPRAGKLESVHAAAGDFVDADAVLVRFGE